MHPLGHNVTLLFLLVNRWSVQKGGLRQLHVVFKIDALVQKHHFKWDLEVVADLHWRSHYQMLFAVCLLGLANDIEFLLVVQKDPLAAQTFNVDFED